MRASFLGPLTLCGVLLSGLAQAAPAQTVLDLHFTNNASAIGSADMPVDDIVVRTRPGGVQHVYDGGDGPWLDELTAVAPPQTPQTPPANMAPVSLELAETPQPGGMRVTLIDRALPVAQQVQVDLRVGQTKRVSIMQAGQIVNTAILTLRLLRTQDDAL